MRVTEDALNLYVSVSDDGRSIDAERIKEKATSEGLVSKEALERMSKSQIINLIFLQGMSTAESLDDNAGRGIGMNAVQEAMINFQGVCDTEIGKGTNWAFTFPKSNVSLSCFIVKIGIYSVAVPKEFVDEFKNHRFDRNLKIGEAV